MFIKIIAICSQNQYILLDQLIDQVTQPHVSRWFHVTNLNNRVGVKVMCQSPKTK